MFADHNHCGVLKTSEGGEFMIDELTRSELHFCVACIWCGVKIRDDAEEDAWGICLKCFYRIMNEQLDSQTKTNPNERVSDR